MRSGSSSRPAYKTAGRSGYLHLPNTPDTLPTTLLCHGTIFLRLRSWMLDQTKSWQSTLLERRCLSDGDDDGKRVLMKMNACTGLHQVTERREAMMRAGDSNILLRHQRTIAIRKTMTFAGKWRPLDDNWTAREATGLRKLTTVPATLTAIDPSTFTTQPSDQHLLIPTTTRSRRHGRKAQNHSHHFRPR